MINITAPPIFRLPLLEIAPKTPMTLGVARMVEARAGACGAVIYLPRE
jgi:hypothetical protein